MTRLTKAKAVVWILIWEIIKILSILIFNGLERNKKYVSLWWWTITQFHLASLNFHWKINMVMWKNIFKLLYYKILFCSFISLWQIAHYNQAGINPVFDLWDFVFIDFYQNYNLFISKWDKRTLLLWQQYSTSFQKPW